jgi:hypothetical protein
MKQKLLRWAAPLAAGALIVVLLSLFLALHLHWAEAGLAVLLDGGLKAAPIKAFARNLALTMLLPFYLVAALVLWCLGMAWAALFKRGFSHAWKAGEGFAITFSALLWVHLGLWWQVPTTLWLIPGLAKVPFWLLLPALLALTLAYPLYWLAKAQLGWVKGPLVLAGWLMLWALVPWAPSVMPRLLSPARGGGDEARVLVIGLDGLREDVGQAATTSFIGTPYPNTYTVIPATRLLWHILWGGDPLTYTVGHVTPDIEEFTKADTLPLIAEAARKGWKPRFYIDDGGTIGLVGRRLAFDDVLMPAAGWENYVNSNLTASYPLLAVWENWGRAFPTTNPWAPMDSGLREALRLGRGSKWVMFHSCLAHIPIFLRRDELAQIPRWWTMPPADLEPYSVRGQITVQREARYDIRRDPFKSYSIRMQSILKAWEPLWNELSQDPSYKNATRILFSDHGERFYRVSDKLRLGGIHGYNLDPWETRAMLKIAGPGFDPVPGPARQDTISLLALRDGFREALATDKAITPATIEHSYPEAPMRYQCIDVNLFTEEPAEYRHLDMKTLTKGTSVAPGGIWFTQYTKTREERAEDVSVGWGRGGNLEVFRPLKAGGAHRYRYEGFLLKTIDTVPEDTYTKEKEKVIKILTP